MDAQDVARYLEAHPDFFAAHPQLLDRLTVPHPHNGQAISLLERQALALLTDTLFRVDSFRFQPEFLASLPPDYAE
ncbi:MAG: DUF484 family protein, partial [Burkholderiaceae bacterium]|nr:DUF484 family protein [Burkholderiaceae bacterium]